MRTVPWAVLPAYLWALFAASALIITCIYIITLCYRYEFELIHFTQYLVGQPLPESHLYSRTSRTVVTLLGIVERASRNVNHSCTGMPNTCAFLTLFCATSIFLLLIVFVFLARKNNMEFWR